MSAGEVYARATGITQEVSGDRLTAADARFKEVLRVAEVSGEHVWTALVQHLIANPITFNEGGHLDAENIVGVHVGCYVCEQGYEEKLVRRRCPGEPK